MPFEEGHIPWNKGQSGYSRLGCPWNKGKHLSEEHRRKISETKKGRTTWTKGKHLSAEHKRKISEALKGRVSWTKGKHLPEEWRKKISLGNRGRMPWTSGKHHSEETKKKISEKNKGRMPWTFGKHRLEETKKKISLSLMNHPVTGDTKRRMSKAYIRNIKKGCFNIRPTALELKFAKICEKYNLPYKYVGDGKFWVENMNPDFVEVNGGKIVIEILGSYWHDETEFSERQKKFAKYGWHVIGIWESELNELSEMEIVQKVIIGDKDGETKSA